MSKSKLIVKDHGLKALGEAFREIRDQKPFVKVGVFDGPPRSDGMTNAQLAAIHEFGAPEANIPERSFIRSTHEEKKTEIQEQLRKNMGKVLLGELPIEDLLGRIGAKLASDIKKTVTAGDPIPPPNTPEVFMRKLAKGSGGGLPRTLVDTGQMIGAVTWEVGTGEGAKETE